MPCACCDSCHQFKFHRHISIKYFFTLGFSSYHIFKIISMASDDKVDTLSTTTSHMPLLGSSKNDRDTHSEPSTSSSLTSDINRNGAKSTDEDNNSIGNNKEKELLLQQGVVLLEDAINYRSIHHKMDMFSISLYRWYHSAHVTWAIYIVIIVLMSLAFLEDPSSLSWSSDPRRNQPRYIVSN